MSDMARDWDELARTNAAYSIVSTPEFEGAGAERLESFWDSGRLEVERILGGLVLVNTGSLTLVEIGCGIGRMTRALAARFDRVIALDVSPEMIGRARASNPNLANVEFRVGSGMDLDGIPDRSVDVVFSWFVLQHLPRAADVLRYVAETGRVLRGGGTAFLHMQTSRNALDHSRRWIERRLYYALPARVRDALFARRGSRLERDFAIRFRVWRGGFVRPSAVARVAHASGLMVRDAQPLGDRYTCFTLRKETAAPGASSGQLDRRSAP